MQEAGAGRSLCGYRRSVIRYNNERFCTWGNVSGIDRDKNIVVIKLSRVAYDGMTAEDMVVVDLKNGNTIEGKWKPSSDTATHLELYRRYPKIAGIVHTHSVNAVAFAQAGLRYRLLVQLMRIISMEIFLALENSQRKKSILPMS